jgi:DNA-binding LytR/AlgR family response regulator
MDGMEAAKAIREFDTEVCIIFITTMYQRAIEGYKVRAFGFIRKPVSYEEFSHELGDAIKNIERAREKDHYLNIRSSGKSFRIPVSRISYCEVRGHYVSLCVDGEVREYRCPIRELEEQLSGYGFFRCHASYLVAAEAIQEIRQNEILLKDGNIVPISQRRRKAFMSALSSYYGDTF